MDSRAVGAMPGEDGWLTWAGPGTELVIAVESGEQVRARIIANHLGGYMYLQSGWAYWLWDGSTRLRQLGDWEEEVAAALAAGRPNAAIPLVLEGWRDEIRIGMQGGGPMAKPPAAREVEAVTESIWFALALRFAEMHTPSEPKHPYARPQHFPIPLPCAARFVLRTVRWNALKAYLIMERELLQGDDATEVASFYRACEAPEELPGAIDPLRWSDDHPIMRQLGHAFDVLYLEKIPYLSTDYIGTDLRDAFARFSDQEMQGEAWAVPVWLLLFGLGMDDRMGDRITNERMLVFLEELREPEKVLATILSEDIRKN